MRLDDVDLMITNARNHPGYQTTLWIDFERLGPQSLFFVRSHLYQQNAHNIRLENLRDIAEYRNHPLFQNYPQDSENYTFYSIKKQVDVAKCLLLSHCLQNDEAEQVFVADFDIEDLALEDPDIQNKMNTYGLVLGVQSSGVAENQLYGCRNSPDIVDFACTLYTRSLHESTTYHGGNAWLATLSEVQAFCRKQGHDPRNVLVQRGHPAGHTLPVNPVYTECGLNAPAYPPLSPRPSSA